MVYSAERESACRGRAATSVGSERRAPKDVSRTFPGLFGLRTSGRPLLESPRRRLAQSQATGRPSWRSATRPASCRHIGQPTAAERLPAGRGDTSARHLSRRVARSRDAQKKEHVPRPRNSPRVIMIQGMQPAGVGITERIQPGMPPPGT
jgi:hypothetical protein